MDEIVVAILTGAFSLAGSVIAIVAESNKTRATMQTAQAVTDTKMEALAAEVREHNNFARRTPVLEEKVTSLEQRVTRLEQKAE